MCCFTGSQNYHIALIGWLMVVSRYRLKAYLYLYIYHGITIFFISDSFCLIKYSTRKDSSESRGKSHYFNKIKSNSKFDAKKDQSHLLPILLLSVRVHHCCYVLLGWSATSIWNIWKLANVCWKVNSLYVACTTVRLSKLVYTTIQWYPSNSAAHWNHLILCFHV